MRFFFVPVIDNTIKADFPNTPEVFCLSPDKAAVMMRTVKNTDPLWQEIIQDDYLKYIGAGIVSVDKNQIQADGVDEAVITVRSENTEVNFYREDTRELIASTPVVAGIATLRVSAITPGLMRIRAGLGTELKVNEVEINAM